jgi:hypothetical protein
MERCQHSVQKELFRVGQCKQPEKSKARAKQQQQQQQQRECCLLQADGCSEDTQTHRGQTAARTSKWCWPETVERDEAESRQ